MLNELERNGLIQRFEFTIELAWKVLKDFLIYEGFNFSGSPKPTVREAFRAGYIDYGQELIDGIEIRNELSHDYSGEKFLENEIKIRKIIYPTLEKLYLFFLNELKKQKNRNDDFN